MNNSHHILLIPIETSSFSQNLAPISSKPTFCPFYIRNFKTNPRTRNYKTTQYHYNMVPDTKCRRKQTFPIFPKSATISMPHPNTDLHTTDKSRSPRQTPNADHHATTLIFNERERERERREIMSGWWLTMADDSGSSHSVVAMGFWV